MAAYVIVLREGPIVDPTEMDEYLRKLAASPADPNLVPLALYGSLVPLEGASSDGVVILRFPTIEDAKTWYWSSNYQSAAAHRKRAAPYRVMLVEGIE